MGTTGTWTFGCHLLEMILWFAGEKTEMRMTFTLAQFFEETKSADMFPKINVASFGDFEMLPRTSIWTLVLVSRVSRGAGYELEAPVRSIFQVRRKCVS